ncbi:jg20628 [Pararge aegeria aegeria]|uniref:Jg20628 protein n=1 Tax=Pararge aegeria aegeria TaxID=348720 RepID=A0A8S4RHS2_9NEOP|nr:jg20628 [Pararge aegeria aegeria]
MVIGVFATHTQATCMIHVGFRNNTLGLIEKPWVGHHYQPINGLLNEKGMILNGEGKHREETCIPESLWRTLRSGRGAAYACSEGEGNAPKSCCGRPPLRLCVLFLGVVGACLVAAGAVLGALRPHPRAPLTLLLLMIGKSGRGAAYACSEGEGNAPKSCCGRPPLRLCVLFLGVVGACLVAAGAVLGALRPHPRAPLTLLLLMIGIGVVLVTAAGLAWRLGARDAPCALLGLRRASCRRLVPRLPPSYARPHHPYAAMLYPEFHYRPPPPTYQASMQEYRLRLLLLDRSAPAVSPPPTYRSNSASLVRGSTGAAWCGSEYSGPPSYRAPRVDPPVTVTDTLPTLTHLELKYNDDTIEPLPKPTEQEKDPDEHLVTIVHTEAQPVIVTVSGSTALNDTHIQPPTEIDILAHL